MQDTRLIMGMPVTVYVADDARAAKHIESVFSYFARVDRRFSTYRAESEVSRMNRGELDDGDASDEMREVLALAERTREESGGYFDIKKPDGTFDPSGIVKGWAIRNAAAMLAAAAGDFYIDAGGDIASSGKNAAGRAWAVGIENPFDRRKILKVIRPEGKGVATSGNYLRGAHIYDPHTGAAPSGLLSITVVGPDVLEADRFATAAFAMGKDGVGFIEGLDGLEAYAVGDDGMATMTSGFGALAAA